MRIKSLTPSIPMATVDLKPLQPSVSGYSLHWSRRLFEPEQLLQPDILALYVAAFSIVAKEVLYRYTMVVARKFRSEMLRANSWHHRSDAMSSVVVLVGVGGTMAGLPYLDAIGAVGVGLMIGHIAWDLGSTAVHELVDAGLDEERLRKIREIILICSLVDPHSARAAC